MTDLVKVNVYLAKLITSPVEQYSIIIIIIVIIFVPDQMPNFHVNHPWSCGGQYRVKLRVSFSLLKEVTSVSVLSYLCIPECAGLSHTCGTSAARCMLLWIFVEHWSCRILTLWWCSWHCVIWCKICLHCIWVRCEQGKSAWYWRLVWPEMDWPLDTFENNV